MRRTLLIILVVVLGGAAGFGLAYLVSHNAAAGSEGASEGIPSAPLPNGQFYGNPRGRNDHGWGMGGMMQPYEGRNLNPSGTRLTLDQAVTRVESAVSSMGSDFQVAEVKEFQRNFYAVVIEKSTGRGAFELLLDPYTGTISYEPGPDMMWNLKYGAMSNRVNRSQDNTITLDEAKSLAQKALDEQGKGATVESNGYAFYGYYTFDYQMDGKIAGMLSVNGLDGQVWFHTWHGSFISEKELSQ